MLADFQQALADLTSMPDFCIASHAGMSCACTVYRMNRLAPLAMNVPHTLRALGTGAKDMLSAYWRDHPCGHAHFFLESDRFCTWLRARIEKGDARSDAVRPLLERESATIRDAINASCTDRGTSAAVGHDRT
jgi:hypothetical protein